MSWNTLDSGLKLFFSREVKGRAGEDLVEKQNAEIGLMPVVANEPVAYGYEAEDRHFVRVFLGKAEPLLTFDDGLEVVKILMTAYMSAEQGRTIDFPPRGLDGFVPAVARGNWKPMMIRSAVPVALFLIAMFTPASSPGTRQVAAQLDGPAAAAGRRSGPRARAGPSAGGRDGPSDGRARSPSGWATVPRPRGGRSATATWKWRPAPAPSGRSARSAACSCTSSGRRRSRPRVRVRNGATAAASS